MTLKIISGKSKMLKRIINVQLSKFMTLDKCFVCLPKMNSFYTSRTLQTSICLNAKKKKKKSIQSSQTKKIFVRPADVEDYIDMETIEDNLQNVSYVI